MAEAEEDVELTAGMWHLLQSMLQERILHAEKDGIGPDDPSSQYRADLSRRLLHHELAARHKENPDYDKVPQKEGETDG